MLAASIISLENAADDIGQTVCCTALVWLHWSTLNQPHAPHTCELYPLSVLNMH